MSSKKEVKLSVALDLIKDAREEHGDCCGSNSSEIDSIESALQDKQAKLESVEARIAELECDKEELEDDISGLENDLENAIDEGGDGDDFVLEAVQEALLDENVVVVLEGGLVRKARVDHVVSVDGEGEFECTVFPPNDEDEEFTVTLKSKRIAAMWTNGSFDRVVKAVGKNQALRGND